MVKLMVTAMFAVMKGLSPLSHVVYACMCMYASVGEYGEVRIHSAAGFPHLSCSPIYSFQMTIICNSHGSGTH